MRGVFMGGESKTRMTEGSISKKIILFAIPLFFGNLFQQLYITTPTDPAKYVRKYTIDSGNTSAGVPISTNIFGANTIPATINIKPDTNPKATVV